MLPRNVRARRSLDEDYAPSVTLTIGDLRSLVHDEVAGVIAECEQRSRPVLVTRDGPAEALAVSVSSIDRLIREGCPRVRVGDAPRFSIPDVIAWLKARAAGGPTHAIPGGRA